MDHSYFKEVVNQYYNRKRTKKSRDYQPNSQSMRDLFFNKNFLQIKSKEYIINYNDMQQQKQLLDKQIKKLTHKLPVKKKVLNDYIDIVNRRKEIIDGMKQQTSEIDKMSHDTNQYFSKYYSNNSYFKKKMDQLMGIIRPENKHIQNIMKFNQSKIDQILLKCDSLQEMDQQEIQQKPQGKRFVTQKEKLMALSGDISPIKRLKNSCITNEKIKFYSEQNDSPYNKSSSVDDKIHLDSDQLAQVDRIIKLQDKMLDLELKCQGNEIIKRRIFQKGMKQSASQVHSIDQKHQELTGQIPKSRSEKDLQKANLSQKQLTENQKNESILNKKKMSLPNESLNFQKIYFPSPKIVNDQVSMSQSLHIFSRFHQNNSIILSQKVPQQDEIKQITSKEADQFEKSLENINVKDVFQIKKQNQINIDKYYFNNTKLRRDSNFSPKQLYIELVQTEQDTPIQNSVKSKVFSPLQSKKLLHSKLVPSHYKNSKSSIEIAYKTLQENCINFTAENQDLRSTIQDQKRKCMKKYKKLQGSHGQINVLKVQANLRQLTGPGFPLPPKVAAQFQLANKF